RARPWMCDCHVVLPFDVGSARARPARRESLAVAAGRAHAEVTASAHRGGVGSTRGAPTDGGPRRLLRGGGRGAPAPPKLTAGAHPDRTPPPLRLRIVLRVVLQKRRSHAMRGRRPLV